MSFKQSLFTRNQVLGLLKCRCSQFFGTTFYPVLYPSQAQGFLLGPWAPPSKRSFRVALLYRAQREWLNRPCEGGYRTAEPRAGEERLEVEQPRRGQAGLALSLLRCSSGGEQTHVYTGSAWHSTFLCSIIRVLLHWWEIPEPSSTCLFFFLLMFQHTHTVCL